MPDQTSDSQGEPARPQRRLTTILFADVKDYSRLMDADEIGTLALLKDRREKLVGHIERFGGRVVSTAGDGLLAEFPSVVDATQCASEVQRELGALNAHDDTPMHFRIGINIGDVIVEGNDLYGEGVNVAARLQSIAEPGGICVSGAVFDQVRNKLTLGYEFLGPQQVKNISDPVPAYRVDPDPKIDAALGEAAARQTGSSDTPGAPDDAQATDEADDDMAAFRRTAGRLGVLAAFLVAINVLSSPGDWWVQWPLIVIAAVIGWRWFSRAGNRRIAPHHRNWQFGAHKGDLVVTRDSAHVGDVQGDVTVEDGVSFKMTGTVHGDLSIGQNADVEILGAVQGEVANDGGSFKLFGAGPRQGLGGRHNHGRR